MKLRVPDVNRAKSDQRNLLAVILENQNDQFYKLESKQGILSQLYTRNQFAICEEKFIFSEEVPAHSISLRECAKKTSLSGGQGHEQCGECKSDECKCKKFSKLCSSQCHKRLHV